MTVKISNLFSSSHTSAMSSRDRDHPFNRSTRPLLADRKPQLLLKKSTAANISTSSNGSSGSSSTTSSNKSSVLSDGKMHGFNDFDIMSQQFKNIQHTHIGYPYGSPPSPTVVNSSDFTFSDNNQLGLRLRPQFHHQLQNGTNIFSSSIAKSSVPPPLPPPNPGYRRVYNDGRDQQVHQQHDRRSNDLWFHHQHAGLITNSDTDGRCNKISTNLNDHLNWNDVDGGIHDRMTNLDQQRSYNNHQRNEPLVRPYDDYDDSGINDRDSLSNGGGVGDNDGPFIFGVHTANTFIGGNSTVINHQIGKFSRDNGKPVLNQSISDTSSSSRTTEKECSLLVKRPKSKKKKNQKDQKFNKENRPRIKCVIVGDGNVGKTNLIRTYLENRFVSDYIPTASDIYNAEVMVNDSPVHITLCDTAGQDTLDPLRELCYPDSDVFILCFSVVKPESFRSIQEKWIPKFAKTKAALLLIGTQADLRTDNFVLNKLQILGEKSISSKEAWEVATSIGAKYIETSSLKQINVKDAFDAAIWDALLPSHLPPTPPLWKKLLCLV